MDTNPRLPAAGLIPPGSSESAQACLRPDFDATMIASTRQLDSLDVAQARWRQSFRREPGQKFIHAGLVGAPQPPPEYRHGIRTAGGDKAGDVFYAQHTPESDLANFMLQQKESIYKSNIREPLGSSYIRGHKLPDQVHDPSFRFGVKTNESESAKTVLYNPTRPPFNRSHGSLDTTPLNQSAEEYARSLGRTTTSKANYEYLEEARRAGGLQRIDPSMAHYEEKQITRPLTREYNWQAAGIDPTNHRFGKIYNPNPAGSYETGVASLLKHAEAEEERTRIGSKRVEEVRSAYHDHLGKGRRPRGSPLAGDSNDPDSSADGSLLNHTGHRSMVFGRPGSHDEWGAGDCIKGSYSEQEQAPDVDLGRSTRKVTMLQAVPSNHADRSFGLPSIRADRRPPKMKNIANDMNFGDESNARGLLFPSQFAVAGVEEEDFLRERTPEDVRKVFKALGREFTPEELERLVRLARARYGVLSIDSFRHVLNQVNLGVLCAECGATLCTHDECKTQQCKHDAQANHSPYARHPKQQHPELKPPAGFTSNTHPSM